MPHVIGQRHIRATPTSLEAEFLTASEAAHEHTLRTARRARRMRLFAVKGSAARGRRHRWLLLAVQRGNPANKPASRAAGRCKPKPAGWRHCTLPDDQAICPAARRRVTA